MSPPSWVDQLNALIFQDRPGLPVIAVLATVDDAGAPQARSVVLRRVSAEGDLLVVSDGRSAKNAEIRARGTAALVIYFESSRIQFRFRCAAEAIPGGRDDWEALTPATRAMFGWPHPGAAWQGPAGFKPELDGSAPIPDSFEALELHPVEVEILELALFPHVRKRYRKGLGWAAERLNP